MTRSFLTKKDITLKFHVYLVESMNIQPRGVYALLHFTLLVYLLTK